MSDFAPSKRKRNHQWEGQQLAAAVRALDELGPPKGLSLATGDKPVCWCICKKPLYTTDIVPTWTGQVHALNNVCKDCTKEASKLATLVCVACKQVVGRLTPHKDKTGFVFEAGKFYHIDFCGTCNVERSRNHPSIIIEPYLFQKRLGRKM